MTQINNPSTNSNKERASVLGSNAGITVEASLTIPVFLFAVLCLVYLLEIRSIQTKVFFAAETAAKTAAQDVAVMPFVNVPKIEKLMKETLGEERMEQSILKNGSGALDCSGSYFSYLTGEVHVVAAYSVQLPFPWFKNLTADFKEEVRVRGWTGFKSTSEDPDGEKIVYITDNAEVYHEDRNCTYLKLAIRFVPYAELESSRNVYGERYTRCEKCAWDSPMAGVFVTDKGEKYHTSLRCSGLKRTIYAVKLSEAGPVGGCTRCTGHSH